MTLVQHQPPHRALANCPTATPAVPWHKLKDPFPAWSHWLGVALSLAGGVALLSASAGGVRHAVALAVYAVSLVLLYFSSALAHSVHCGPSAAARLDRFDYAAIFLLIAGSYTPLCVITLRGRWGLWLLAAVWAAAAVGIASLYLLKARTHWPRVLCYVLMSWLAVAAAGELTRVLPKAAIVWLLLGGVLYTVGAVVFLTGRPRLWPGRFGPHDLWHCMVLAASACHFGVILQYVARAA